MADDKLTTILRGIATEQVPADTATDLWPTIRRRLPAGAAHPRRRPWRPLFAIAATLVAVVLMVALVPTGRAAVRETGIRFGFLVVKPMPTGAPPLSTGSPAPRATLLPVLSIAEARARSQFHILEPMALPTGLTERGAALDTPDPSGTPAIGPAATLYYASAAPGSAFAALTVRMADGVSAAPTFVPTTAVDDLTVRGHPALYAHGRWVAGTWDTHADSALLTWSEGGYTLTIMADGMGTSAAELAAIAESLR